MALIALAGGKLTRYGDVIAEKTGLSGTWIGIVMLATVTSLPELVTGISAVTLANAPDIAVGGVFGSCVFNLAIIVLLDFVHRPETVYCKANQGLILSAAYGLVLVGFSGFSLLISKFGLLAFGHVSLSTPLIILIYFLAMRSIFDYERNSGLGQALPEPAQEIYGHLSLRQAIIRYSAASAVVVAVGIALPFVGDHLGEAMGWQRTFVGNFFIAMATSLPEMVVTLAAARMGALDMAIGNLFGSNLFNILVIALNDLVYPAPLLANVSNLHLISALSAMIMTGLAVVGIFLGTRRRPLKTVGWTSFFLIFFYLMNAYLLHRLDR